MEAKTKHTIAMVLSAIAALGFLFFGVTKLMGNEMIVENFQKWGLSETVRYAIGGLEIAGAIGLFIPGLRKWAALGLMGLMLGAIYIHMSNGEGIDQAGMAIGMFVLVGVVYLLRR